jgi:hypothetical protein
MKIAMGKLWDLSAGVAFPSSLLLFKLWLLSGDENFHPLASRGGGG